MTPYTAHSIKTFLGWGEDAPLRAFWKNAPWSEPPCQRCGDPPHRYPLAILDLVTICDQRALLTPLCCRSAGQRLPLRALGSQRSARVPDPERQDDPGEADPELDETEEEELEPALRQAALLLDHVNGLRDADKAELETLRDESVRERRAYKRLRQDRLNTLCARAGA